MSKRWLRSCLLGVVGLLVGMEQRPAMGWVVPQHLGTLSQRMLKAQATSPRSESICPAQLGEPIDAIANRPEFQRMRWGILVRSLEGGETLYGREGDRLFIPASNAKLLTTAAVLLQLGTDFRIRTSVYRVRSEPGVVLRLVGRGDPSLTDAVLTTLVQQVRSQGITQVDRLIVDDSYFRGDPVNPNWEWEDIQAGYGAPVNSLIVNRNEVVLNLLPQAIGQPLRVVWQNPAEAVGWQVENHSRTVGSDQPEFIQVGRDLSRPLLRVWGQLRVGSDPEDASIAVTNPSQNFLQHLRRAFAGEGINVRQATIATTATPPPGPEIAAVTSPPLSELLTEANQNSDNLYAEALLRILGQESNPSSPVPAASSLAAGLAAIATPLTQLGVPPHSYALADGSGLSRKNLVSPAAFVETLSAIARTPQAQVYRNSLAIAGISGTLRNRFRETPVQGRLWGKTGAISGIAALSGYLDPPNHPPLAFTILVNHFDQPVRTVRPAIDEMVLLFARLRPCP